MFFNVSVTHLTRWVVIVACIANTWLYLYPVWQSCVFPSRDGHVTTAFQETISQHISSTPYLPSPLLAPFRLLVLADPQLEGDSSLPDPEDALSHKIYTHWHRLTGDEGRGNLTVVGEVIEELLMVDIPTVLGEVRKRLDLFGNDYYLAHIFRTLHWWTKPTHTTVLGDLIGSQWVDDEEFAWRGWRFWNRVFSGGYKVEDEIMDSDTIDKDRLFKMDDPAWSKRIVNIAGNHDIGYAGDISRMRMERFEKAFGKANWDIRFQYPLTDDTNMSTDIQPTLHMVVLNSMLLDTPAMDEELQNNVYGYLNSVITERVKPVEDRSDFTLLLTHVPLHKEEGVCVDVPFFDFWEDEDCDGACKPFALKEQNHLSVHSSRPGILEALFGMSGNTDAPMQGKGRSGLILNGHDHEGCDVWHHIPLNSTLSSEEGGEGKTNWQAERWKHSDPTSSHTGIREVTLRSMMGDYGGNAGLLSAWFDFEQGEWKYEIQMCKVGIQHIWWAIHALDIIALILLMFSLIRQLTRKVNTRTLLYRRTELKAMKVD
jgi:hypothetical protein